MEKLWKYGLLAVCGIALAGCSTGNTAESGDETAVAKQEFSVVVQQEMPTADLSLATDTISFSALNNVYEGLYRLGKNNQPEPAGAAEMAEVSEDGLTYKIKLREDAKWSNGDPVTANDYVFAWQRTVTPETAAEYAYLFESVENAAEITAGNADPDTLGITAISDYELEIKLAKATPYFDYLLAFPSFFPQNQATVEEYGKEFAQNSENAVYNGPFVLADFDGPGTDTTWTYNKNDDYWDSENVQMDTINVSVVKEANTALNLFKGGEADDVILTGELAQQSANDPAYVSQPDARTTYIEMNQITEDSPYRNVNLRKAISYAIDRDAVVNSILGNGSIASVGLMPKDLMAGPDGTDFSEAAGVGVSTDKDQAQEYWNKAKEELGIDSLSIDILSSDEDSDKKITEYLQATLQELDGITVTLSPVPFSVRLDRSSAGDFEMVLSGWGADYLDASSFSDLFVTDNSYNRGHYSNPEYDALVTAAAGEHVNDPELRWNDLLEAEKVLMADQGVIPVFQKAEAHLRNPQLKDVVAHPAGAQYDYKWTYIEE